MELVGGRLHAAAVRLRERACAQSAACCTAPLVLQHANRVLMQCTGSTRPGIEGVTSLAR